jgi:hypothetical protein
MVVSEPCVLYLALFEWVLWEHCEVSTLHQRVYALYMMKCDAIPYAPCMVMVYIYIYIYATVGKIMALCELADYWLYHIWIRLKQNGFLSVNHILTYGLKNANPMKHKPHQSICHGSCERIHRVKHNWLAVSTPLKKYARQIGSSSHSLGKNKTCSKPPTSINNIINHY